MRRLGTEQRLFLEQATSMYQDELDHGRSPFSTKARDYLDSRGLHPEFVAPRYRLGFVAEPLPGHELMQGRLCIPYLTPAGVVNLKFRCIQPHECKIEGCPKYMGLPGSGTYLYNARAVLAAHDTVIITEGEFDAMAVSFMTGVPAVGFPGAQSWTRQAHWPRVFAGLDVVVVADGDKPGAEAAARVAASIPDARVVSMPDGMDANSFLLKEGADEFRSRCGVLD